MRLRNSGQQRARHAYGIATSTSNPSLRSETLLHGTYEGNAGRPWQCVSICIKLIAPSAATAAFAYLLMPLTVIADSATHNYETVDPYATDSSQRTMHLITGELTEADPSGDFRLKQNAAPAPFRLLLSSPLVSSGPSRLK